MPRTKKQGKKLGIDQVREIRKELARKRNPKSAPTLAREYGVSNRTIYDIRDGKTWA